MSIYHLDKEDRAIVSNHRDDGAHHELLARPESHGKGRALLPNGSHGVAAAIRPSPHGRNAHVSNAEVTGSGDDGDSQQPASATAWLPITRAVAMTDAAYG